MEVQLHAAKGAGAKGKRFHSGATKLRRMVNSCLKGHLIFLRKPAVIPEIERGRYFFLSNYLSSFWCAGDLSMHISSCLRAQRKELPPHHLCQWRRLPRTPADCLWKHLLEINVAVLAATGPCHC